MDRTESLPAPVRPDLVALLLSAAEAPPDWARTITPQARLDADLALDECELATLGSLLLECYGPVADLAALRGRLDLEQLAELTVADLQRELLPPGATGPGPATATAVTVGGTDR